ncbi:hypothetical protein Sste5346_005759 [Sporothrix stenoceras]|uniref:Uncharacterized protein n=1 Tax=Sporothrix stenoceras TaxID=5173 RepID=A0ABR3Z2U8_9PEZI
MFPFPSQGNRKEKLNEPIITVGVPKAPDFTKDFTNMGPNVAAPWRKGGVFTLIPDNKIKAAVAADSQQYTNRYGVRVRYSRLHSLHPWLVRYLAASPGVEDAYGSSDGQGADSAATGWPVGFPHPSADVVRRKYAIKNRTEPLWWFAVAFPNDPHLPHSNLVRDRMRQKLQGALKVALERRGYAPNGIRLEGQAGAKARFSQLYGSLRVEGPIGPALRAPFDDLAGFLAQAIIVVEDLLGGRKQTMSTQEQNRRIGSSSGLTRTNNRTYAGPGKKSQDSGSTGAKGKKKDRFDLLLDPSLF